MKLKIPNNEIQELLVGKSYTYPKYATQIMNLANQNAQGTRAKVVGQMSDLIQKFPDSKLEEWEEWYLNKHPESLSLAANKVFEMVTNFKDVMAKIDREMVEKWVKDLVILKTFIGLKFQEAILKSVATELKTTYRLATPEEESQGIDGLIGEKPVSIKPTSYEMKKSLSEKIEVPFIFYEKLKDGIKISFDESLS